MRYRCSSAPVDWNGLTLSPPIVSSEDISEKLVMLYTNRSGFHRRLKSLRITFLRFLKVTFFIVDDFPHILTTPQMERDDVSPLSVADLLLGEVHHESTVVPAQSKVKDHAELQKGGKKKMSNNNETMY